VGPGFSEQDSLAAAFESRGSRGAEGGIDGISIVQGRHSMAGANMQAAEQRQLTAVAAKVADMELHQVSCDIMSAVKLEDVTLL